MCTCTHRFQIWLFRNRGERERKKNGTKRVYGACDSCNCRISYSPLTFSTQQFVINVCMKWILKMFLSKCVLFIKAQKHHNELALALVRTKPISLRKEFFFSLPLLLFLLTLIFLAIVHI